MRTRRIKLIRNIVRLTSEELKRVQNGLEKRTSKELAAIAHKWLLDGREEKAIELMLSDDNQNRLSLRSRLDELLIPYCKCIGLDFPIPEETSYAEVNDDILKLEEFESTNIYFPVFRRPETAVWQLLLTVPKRPCFWPPKAKN